MASSQSEGSVLSQRSELSDTDCSSSEKAEMDGSFHYHGTEGTTVYNPEFSVDTINELLLPAAKTEEEYSESDGDGQQSVEKDARFNLSTEETTTGSYEEAIQAIIDNKQSPESSDDETTTESFGHAVRAIINDGKSRRTSWLVSDDNTSLSENLVQFIPTDLDKTVESIEAQPYIPLPNQILGAKPYISLHYVDPRIKSIVHWKHPARSAVALISGLALLISIHELSLLTTLATIAMVVITSALMFRFITYATVRDPEKRDAIFHGLETIHIPKDRWQAQYRAFREAIEHTERSLKEAIRTNGYQETLKDIAIALTMIFVGHFLDTTKILIIAYAAAFAIPYLEKNHESDIRRMVKIIKRLIRTGLHLNNHGRVAVAERS